MRTGILILAFLLCGAASRAADIAPVRALYLSGNHTYLGFVHKPKGPGPFPAVVFNQAVANSPRYNEGNDFASLAKVFISRGYVFFIPGRHPPIPGTPAEEQKLGKDGRLIRNHEQQAGNIVAAVAWLKTQMYVDETRVVMFSESSGAVSSLFLVDSEIDLNIRGMVLFSPGTQVFRESPKVSDMLKVFVQKAKMPIFLIQCENERTLTPIEILGAELEAKGGLNRAKTFPSYGDSYIAAQKFPTEGAPVWQREVFAFFQQVLARNPITAKTGE